MTSQPVDMIQFIQQDLAKRRRGRSCIVLTHDYSSQKKWATELASLVDAAHVDLLEKFSLEEELAERLSSFTVQELFNLFSKHKDKKVLIVTGIEFLRASWANKESDREDFANRIEMWQAGHALVLVTQYEKYLAERKFTRFPTQRFVIDQKETYSLS